jgi:hypothetical protein
MVTPHLGERRVHSGRPAVAERQVDGFGELDRDQPVRAGQGMGEVGAQAARP